MLYVAKWDKLVIKLRKFTIKDEVKCNAFS